MTRNSEAIARAYLDAISTKQLDQLDTLVAPDVRFTGPARALTSRDQLIAALRGISAIHVRSDIKRVFAEADEVCVIYDLVTDTAIGAVPTVEWLVLADSRIQSINLYYDQLPWQRVREAMS